MRSGIININSGSSTVALRNGGYYEFVWSHAAAAWGSVIYGSGASSTAYFLRFNSDADSFVSTSSGPDHRWRGVSLRCLSTAVEGEEKRDIMKPWLGSSMDRAVPS